MLTSVKEQLIWFFENHKNDLENSYPGLGLTRLLSETLFYLEKNHGHPYTDQDLISRGLLDPFFQRVLSGEPLEYINNCKYFYDNEFYLNNSVLIPRYETEVLVDLIINRFRSSREKLDIIDMCTGSGIIALTLAKNLTRSVVKGVDICPQALQVANINLNRLSFSSHFSGRVEFIESDLFAAVNGKVDLIVSNPPYYKKLADSKFIHHQVQAFEPELAITINDHEFSAWYSRFFGQAYDNLGEDGLLFMETDAKHLAEILNMAREHKFKDAQVYKDLTGAERFFSVKK